MYDISNSITIQERTIAYASSDQENVVAELMNGEIKLYSDEKLKNDTLEAILSTNLGSKFQSTIEKYFRNDIIVPCRYNTNIFKSLFFKTKVFFLGGFGFLSDRDITKVSIAGFYNTESGKIYLIMDNNTDIFQRSIDEQLVQLLIHELSHYASNNVRDRYFSSCKETMLLWYTNYFNEFFDLNKKYKNEIIDISTKFYLHAKEIETSTTEMPIKKMFTKHKDILSEFKQYSNFNEDLFDEKVKYFMTILFLALTNKMNKLVFNLRKDPSFILAALKTYVNILKCPVNRIRYTLFYQEFLFPSEIMAVASINPKHAEKYMKLL